MFTSEMTSNKSCLSLMAALKDHRGGRRGPAVVAVDRFKDVFYNT